MIRAIRDSVLILGCLAIEATTAVVESILGPGPHPGEWL